MEPDGPELDAVITARMAAAGRGLRPGSRAWAEAMDELAESLLDEAVSGRAGGVPDGAGVLDAAVLVRRRAIGSLDAELQAAAGADLRHNLGVDLTNRYRLGGGLSDLENACELGRVVLAEAGPADQLIAAGTSPVPPQPRSTPPGCSSITASRPTIWRCSGRPRTCCGP
jgi:hypothetical protein